jgi:acetoin utilization deacetylase AcuC-like enzyme
MLAQARALHSLKVFYSEDMVSDAGGARVSPSDRKPKLVSEALLRTRWPIELVPPEPTPISAVCRVHDAAFVDEVLQLARPNGFGSYSQAVTRSVLYTCGACYGSSLVALSEGISASLTSGFHHAGPRSVRGFCTFNGLMVTAARLLAEGRAQRIAIVDCDYHYGNGTQDIIDAQACADRVLHVSFGQTFRRPEQAGDYLAAVADLRRRFQDFRPQLILYQAGADPHIADPFGGLLTTEQMRARDRTLLGMARELFIPLSWNLAGGYQIESDGSIPRVVELHLNTFEEALRVWQLL